MRTSGKLRQRAKAVVVSANASETPRLLLMSTSARFPNGLTNSNGIVGKYLMLGGGATASGLFEHRLNDYHVVIAGSGRIGRSVADALSHLRLPFVLVESDDRRVQRARAAGVPIIYGDASQPVVLEAAGIQHARAMLVTVPAFTDVRSIVTATRTLRPDLSIIARAESSEALQALYGLGIQQVTSPQFEAAIEMTRQVLMHFDVAPHDVLGVASAIRHQRYEPVGGTPDSSPAPMSRVGEIARQLELTWTNVSPESPLDGRTLSEMRIRTTTGASVVGIIRNGVLLANPSGDLRLEVGDLVALLGTRDQIDRFEQATAVARV